MGIYICSIDLVQNLSMNSKLEITEKIDRFDLIKTELQHIKT